MDRKNIKRYFRKLRFRFWQGGAWIPCMVATIVTCVLAMLIGYSSALRQEKWSLSLLPASYYMNGLIVIGIGCVIGYFFDKNRDKLNYLLATPGSDDPVTISHDKERAMHPDIDRTYLSRVPETFTIGRDGNRYVRIPLNPNYITHCLVVGAPGSWKSTTILNSLIWNFNFAKPEDKATVFAIDVKPELQRKSVVYSRKSQKVKVINPASNSSYYWGFNPYYNLSQDNSDDELERRMDTIARSLIATSEENENAIFYHTAQNIMVGFLLYDFRKGLSFMDSMHKLMAVSVKDMIAEIMSDAEMLKNHPKLRMILQAHDGDKSEMLQDAENTMHEMLRVFSNTSVHYCLQGNSRMASPEDLTKGISIFLSIPDDQIEQFRPIFRLITQLVLNYLGSIPERERSGKNVPIIWLLIDEFGTIGHLDIEGPLARFRSRKISIWLCTQGLSQIDQTYGKDGRRSIVTNCETTLVLSCRDDEADKFYSAIAGNYRETKIANTRNGIVGITHNASQNLSTEYRPIFDASDFSRLNKDKKIIAFVDGGFIYADKCPYFMIPAFNELSEKIVATNDLVMNDEGVE